MMDRKLTVTAFERREAADALDVSKHKEIGIRITVLDRLEAYLTILRAAFFQIAFGKDQPGHVGVMFVLDVAAELDRLQRLVHR